MDYGSLGFTKLDYAKTLAATLGYFLLQQRDAVGLAPFTDVIEEYVPPAYRAGQLRRLLVQLERPPRRPVTRLAGCLEELGRRLLRRGMVILISDFLSPLDGLELALETLSQRGRKSWCSICPIRKKSGLISPRRNSLKTWKQARRFMSIRRGSGTNTVNRWNATCNRSVCVAKAAASAITI
jgi:hypothetical protein